MPEVAGSLSGLLDRTALQVAPELLGAAITVRSPGGEGPVTIRLTEVEAYEGERDPGSHAYRGRTARTAPMFSSSGRLYVYFTYGMHWCANVVCGPEGTASAVLLRAGEVVDGLAAARVRRPAARRDVDLARGPARLAQALGLDGEDSGVLLTPDGRASLRLAGDRPASLASGPRVGVAGAGGDGEDYPWRFWLPGEPTVSAYRPAVRRPRRSTSTGQQAAGEAAH